MKKLLLFLLLPLFSYGQNVQAFLKHYNNTTDVEITSEVAIQEGDTLRTEVHLVAVGSDDYTALADAKYFFLDLQYNHKILSPITNGYTFTAIDNIGSSNNVTELYDFSSTSFSELTPNLIEAYTRWQSNEATYSEQNAVWSVKRIAIQMSVNSIQDLLDASTLQTDLPIFEYISVVKAGGADETEPETRINLGTIQDSNGANITSFYSSFGNKFQYSVDPATTYSAKLHFDLPDTLDPTNFKVFIGQNFEQETTEYTLDANSDIIINEVELDSTYYAYNLEPIDGSYIPNVHTVTDAYRAF